MWFYKHEMKDDRFWGNDRYFIMTYPAAVLTKQVDQVQGKEIDILQPNARRVNDAQL